jgi:KUP system potassium uptake protein
MILIMRADNRGDGGVLALGTLASRAMPEGHRPRPAVTVLAVVGLALFFGDGLITPAISVLSAVEGLETAAPAPSRLVVLIAAGVLVALFLIQRRGTASVGRIFGPVMALLFATLGVLGLIEILHSPDVLRALDPRWAVGLFGVAGV